MANIHTRPSAPVPTHMVARVLFHASLSLHTARKTACNEKFIGTKSSLDEPDDVISAYKHGTKCVDTNVMVDW